MISSPLFAMMPPSNVAGELKEEIAVSDSVVIAFTKSTTSSDTVTCADTVDVSRTLGRVVSDTMAVSDSVTTVKGIEPDKLPLALWLAAPFSTPTWAGSSSAGVSGSLNFTTWNPPGGTAPTNGTALNGFTTADFNGTSSVLNYPAAAGNSALIPSLGLDGSWTFFILYNADTIATDFGQPSNNAALVQIADSYSLMDQSVFIASLRTTVASTFGVAVRDTAASAFREVMVSAPAATGAWILGQARYSHVAKTLTARTNSSAWATPVTSTPILYSGYQPVINIGYNVPEVSYRHDGRIAEIIWVSTNLSDAQCNEVKAYLNTKYALSL